MSRLHRSPRSARHEIHAAAHPARRVKAALQMRLNKTDQNDAEGLAQVVRTGWYHANVHIHFGLERHLVDRQTDKNRRSPIAGSGDRASILQISEANDRLPR